MGIIYRDPDIPYIICFYVVEKEAWLYRHCIGENVVKKLGVLFLNFNLAFQNPSLDMIRKIFSMHL